MEVGEYLPELHKQERHIVWLDYDYRLDRSILDDVRSSAYHLSPGSFIFVTVDAEPPRRSSGPAENWKIYRKVSGDLWDPRWSNSDFEKEKLQYRSLDVLGRAFRDGVAGRLGVRAIPCFRFVYADGHQMATLGVQIGGDKEAGNLERIQDEGAGYLVLDYDSAPFRIDVPVLTRRERLLLESVMPSGNYERAQVTGVGEDDFRRFANVYRYIPSYAELLLG